MTAEEEIAYLKGRIDALSQLCSFLVATHVNGDNLTQMFNLRAEKELNQPGLSNIDHAHATGYASVSQNIAQARKIFGKNKAASNDIA